jgi:hypothetical protein
LIKPFVFSKFGAHLVNLERATAAMELALKPVATDAAFHQSILRGAIPNMTAAVEGLVADCLDGELPISQPVSLQIVDLLDRLRDCQEYEWPAVAENARLTRQVILNDLGQHLFFCIEGTEARGFGRPEPWGALVNERYSAASKDIEAAHRCLALREWTASVFHCMRVLEHGLRPMATRFDVSFATDSWHAVIQGIENGIDGLRNKKGLTEADRKDITFYSDAAMQFRYFKDAWRNHVSHARTHYDDKDAPRIHDHVRDFMQHLATIPA